MFSIMENETVPESTMIDGLHELTEESTEHLPAMADSESVAT